MLKNWKVIAKIAVAVLTALLGAVGAAASGVQIQRLESNEEGVFIKASSFLDNKNKRT